MPTKIYTELESGVVGGFVTDYKQINKLVEKLPSKAVYDSINKKVIFRDENNNVIAGLTVDLATAGSSDMFLPFTGKVNTVQNTSLVVNTETVFQASSDRNYVYMDEGGNRFLYFDRTTETYYTKWKGDTNSYNGKLGSDSYMDVSITPAIPKESVFFINEGDDSTPYYFEYSQDTRSGSFRRVTSKATDVRTSEAITIAGGPLANNVVDSVDVWPSGWVDSDGNKVIPAGKSLQEILTSLFLKETQGTVSWGDITWNPQMNAPTVSLSKSGTVEVGTEVTITANTVAGLKANTNIRQSSLSWTPSPNGYFEGDTWKNIAKSVTKNGDNPTGTLTVSVALKIGNTAGNISNNKFTVGQGTNTVTATQTGYTVTCDKLVTTTVYGSTNTRKKITTAVATLNDPYPEGASKHTKTPVNTTASASVTGARFMFWGGSTTVPTSNQINSAYVRSNYATYGGTAATGTGTKTIKAEGLNYIYIALPAGRTLSDLYPMSGGQLASAMASVTSYTVSVEGANGFTAASYTVYEYRPQATLGEDYTVIIK